MLEYDQQTLKHQLDIILYGLMDALTSMDHAVSTTCSLGMLILILQRI